MYFYECEFNTQTHQRNLAMWSGTSEYSTIATDSINRQHIIALDKALLPDNVDDVCNNIHDISCLGAY